MLNVMRENLKSLKWIMWIVAISMVGYLGSFFFDGTAQNSGGSAWAAKVGQTHCLHIDIVQGGHGLVHGVVDGAALCVVTGFG